MSKKAENGSTVSIECVGKLQNGMVFTDSKVDGPIKFEVGKFDVIRGLNTAVVGMEEGEVKNVTITSADAFGEYDEKLLASISKDDLPPNATEGMQLKSESDDGQEVIWTIREIQDDKVILDGNHLLAGQSLDFEIKLLKID